MRPARGAAGAIGISCTQALGRSVVMLASVQVSRIRTPGIGDAVGLRVNVYHSSVRFQGLGVLAALRIASATLGAWRAVPAVPATLWSRKLAPMKSTYQGQAVPW